MKTIVTTTLFALTLLIGLQTAAHAEQILTVNVPHDFIVNNTSFPAGSYIVSRSETAGPLAAILIQRRDGGSGSFVLPIAFDGAVADKAQLTFDSIDGVYILRKLDTSLGVYTFGTQSIRIKTAMKAATKPSSGN
jgi:hypothetical protein